MMSESPLKSPSPRPALDALPPSIHGARDHGELARLGISPDEIIDFSANANPYGPPPNVLQVVQTAAVADVLAPYPDRDCLDLKVAIAAAENLPADCILPGNGTAELIQAIALAFVQPGSRHLILGPTFGEYARAIHLMAGEVHEYRPAVPDMRFDLEETAAAVQRLQPDGVWLCNPNNPTGQQWTAEQLASLQSAAPRALWIIDEAYRFFPLHPVSAWSERANQIILRSLTKDYALAGLRLGYAVAVPTVIKALRSAQVPWSVNSLAQIAGAAAMQPSAREWRAETLAQLRCDALNLWDDLRALGLKLLPTDAAFALLEVGDAAAFRQRLLAQRLLARDATSFGLPGHVRIAARRPEENRLLLDAIRQM